MANLIAPAVATAILVAIPGPNVALIVATSIRHGFRAGASTALGVTDGFLVAAGIGLALARK